MRMHEFMTPTDVTVRIDLDKIAAVEDQAPGAIIYAGGASFSVRTSYDEVVLLLDVANPEAAHHYEDHLAELDMRRPSRRAPKRTNRLTAAEKLLKAQVEAIDRMEAVLRAKGKEAYTDTAKVLIGKVRRAILAEGV